MIARIAMLLWLCGTLLLAQTSPVADQDHGSPSPCGRSGCEFVYVANDKDCEQDSVNQVRDSTGAGTSSQIFGPMDILSDTMGVDFGPYLQGVLKAVKTNWSNLMPESVKKGKKGKVSIEFAIMKDGRVAGLRLEQGGSSGDVALDRAAYGSITGSDPFPPLPSEFGGQYLALRFHFFYNPDRADLEANPSRVLTPIEILSDTQGVDFGPYLSRVLHDVRVNWMNVVPQEAQPPTKSGKVSIKLAILKDGRVAGMKVERCGSSGDVALDRAAWLGITAADPFPPLPTEFAGQHLALRFHFYYNPANPAPKPTDTSTQH